jgi:hypothetical protein
LAQGSILIFRSLKVKVSIINEKSKLREGFVSKPQKIHSKCLVWYRVGVLYVSSLVLIEGILHIENKAYYLEA